ncbi:hypothetical protein Cgig2_025838 [Carnegiea gigantea]|uniref:Major facilitator superfamily (MFS) profile domain-containing protein n=1 Tax=Carnegiea gigantea TaxID=171969 RepID=A0A9Q1Q6U6_9CARY|nr:hypothetical protein Cgig2_025838 [Carnegiea gigantea]
MVQPHRLTLFLVNLAGIMEKADESILPGVYKEVGEALDADPTGLGSLTLLRSIVQSACYPLAVCLAARHNRAHVAASRALNGIGLAIVAPAIQSLVADSTNETNRGTAFGWLQLTANVGSIFGGLCSVLIAPLTFMGIPGWRMSFHLVGMISVLVGILVRLYAKDPHFPDDTPKGCSHIANESFSSQVKELVQEAKLVVKIPSFQIIVAQGVTGSFPWSALSFAPMWFELMGFTHAQTAVLLGLFTLAASFGGLFGGWMGDILSQRFPNAGRIILAQISSGSAVPLAALLLLGLPEDPSTTVIHGVVMVITGFFISWNSPATNNPIFAEVVPEKSRTSIYALDRSFESILASFAPAVVGILAQHVYGYKPMPEGSTLKEETATDHENATSLAKALYVAIVLPMSLCCIIYSFLYCTYPIDRDRAHMQALIEAEMKLLEADDLTRELPIDITNSKELNLKDVNVGTEIDYELVNSVHIDADDERKLL